MCHRTRMLGRRMTISPKTTLTINCLMTKHLYILIGLGILSIIGLIWIGYTLTNTKVSQKADLTKNTIPNNQAVSDSQNTPAKSNLDKFGLPDNKPQKTPASPPLVYEATHEEKALYFKGIANLLPHSEKCIDNNPDFYVSMKKKRAESLTYFENLLKTYPHSSFYAYYCEIAEQLRNMVDEDENWKGGHPAKIGLTIIWSSSFGDITANIYHLRYCLYAKDNEQGRYKLALPPHGFIVGVAPGFTPQILHPSLNAESLIKWPAKRNEIVHSLLDLLEDQRPIIAVEPDRLPAKFYRYQDAAREILEYIVYEADSDKKLQEAKKEYHKNHPDDEGWKSISILNYEEFTSGNKRVRNIPPQELPENEYFSEYLEKQTSQDRQNTINYIKKWVEETLANPPKQEETPEEPK